MHVCPRTGFLKHVATLQTVKAICKCWTFLLLLFMTGLHCCSFLPTMPGIALGFISESSAC